MTTNRSGWLVASVTMCLSATIEECRAQVTAMVPGVDPMSYVVQWGQYAYDTRSREGRLTKVVCGWNNTAHLRSDGRLFVQGPGWVSGPGLQMVTEVPPLPPGVYYTDVSLNLYGAMAIRSDGSAIGWGSVAPTQLAPVAPALPAGLSYTRVALSNTHGLLLRSDRAVVAFGGNSFGECNVPPLPQGIGVVDIQAGFGRSAILLADGTVMLFGNNQFGQSTVPTLPPGVTYTAMAAKRNNYTLLLRSDGLIEAFGSNANGECNVPALPAGVRYDFIGAGDSFGAAARSDNSFVAWGAGSSSAGLSNPPLIPAGLRCRSVDAGQVHVAALMTDGSVLSWGHNDFCDHYIPYRGPLGQAPRRRHVHVSSGTDFSLITFSDGNVEGFGMNNGGQLNVPLLPPGVSYLRAEAGGVHSLALRSDGTIVAFGFNGFGALNVPPLPAGTTYTDMSVENGHSAVIRSDGNAFAFGDNSAGQCSIPPLPTGVTYVKAAVSANRTVLLRSDGALAFCGLPYFGTLPVAPPGTRFVDISASAFFAVAIASDNTVVPWGVLSSPAWVTPSPLPSGVYYVQSYGGYNQTTFRRSDGRIDVMGEDGLHGTSVPGLEVGSSCVQVGGVWASLSARMSSTCTYIGFTPGCAGSMSAAKLIPRDTPRIGRTFELRVRNLPVNLAALGMGLQRQAAPIPLAAIGMPGCSLGIQVDAVALLAGQGAEATFQMPIPDQVNLVGLHFYQQALVLDPAAGNGFGAVVSEASEGVIGYP